MKITDRFCQKLGIGLHHENRMVIFPERFLIAIVIAIFFKIKNDPDPFLKNRASRSEKRRSPDALAKTALITVRPPATAGF